MAELPEIRLGTQLIYQVAVGEYLMGWNELSASVPPTSNVVANFITASGITDSTQISAVTTLYNDLSAYALLDKLDVVYPFVGGNATAHSYNLLDTGSYTLSFTGNWTHNVDGITSDGSTAYANTQFQPGNADSTDWATSGSMGLYSRTKGAQKYDMGSSYNTGGTGRQTALLIKFDANDSFYAGLPVGSATYTGSVEGDGFYAASLVDSTTKGYIDGQNVVSAARGTYVLPSYSMLIGAFRSDAGAGITGYSARNYAFGFIGGGLTDADVSNLYNAVQTYETNLGREVAPIPVQRGLSLWLDAGNSDSYPGSGTTWTDLSPSGNDVTLNAGVSYSSADGGKLVFNPASDGEGTIGTYIQPPGEFTLTTWLNLASTPGCIIGDAGNVQPANEKINFAPNGNILVRVVEGGDSVNFDFGYLTGSMNNTWHQITVMRDSSDVIYACVDDNDYVTGSVLSGTPRFKLIGDNNNGSQNIDGAYSNLLFYTSSLTQDEVNNNYNAFKDRY